MTIKKQLAHPSNYVSDKTRPTTDIKYLVVHYTGNDGDSDEANAAYFQGANKNASAHYFVDDGSVTQSVPDENTAWSVGKDYSGGKAAFWGKCTNANSLNVEMCDAKKDGKYMYTPQTYANTAELVKMLVDKYKIPPDNILRHYDVCGKICPAWFIGSAENEAAWRKFKADVTAAATVQPTQPATVKTPIAGKPELTAEQLAAFLTSRNAVPKISCSPIELARFYIQEGGAEGVRGDLAFCQALWETGNFAYGGQVPPSANNYCGLGAFNGTTQYAVFDTPQKGVRAHIQHLVAYATRDALKMTCVDPRFANARTLELSPNWEDLGGKWAVPGFDKAKYKDFAAAYAAGDTYGQNIVKLWQAAKTHAAKNAPPAPVKTPEEITVDNAIADGIITDRAYWLGVLNGTVKPVPEYLNKVFDNAHAKIGAGKG